MFYGGTFIDRGLEAEATAAALLLARIEPIAVYMPMQNGFIGILIGKISVLSRFSVFFHWLLIDSNRCS